MFFHLLHVLCVSIWMNLSPISFSLVLIQEQFGLLLLINVALVNLIIVGKMKFLGSLASSLVKGSIINFEKLSGLQWSAIYGRKETSEFLEGFAGQQLPFFSRFLMMLKLGLPLSVKQFPPLSIFSFVIVGGFLIGFLPCNFLPFVLFVSRLYLDIVLKGFLSCLFVST